MYTLEVSIVWCHTIVLQVLDCMHTFLWHILLCQHLCQLFSTVVTEVYEDNNITFLDSSINRRVINRLDKLVSNVCCIAIFNRFHHVSSLNSLALNE